MYKLPDGSITKKPKQVIIDGVIHPKNIFTQWSIEQLNEIGIYPVIEHQYDSSRYNVISKNEEIIDGNIHITYDLSEKPDYATKQIESGWETLRQERNELLKSTDFMMLYDYYNFILTENERTEIVNYRMQLRDLPQVTEKPVDVVWPKKPEKIAKEV